MYIMLVEGDGRVGQHVLRKQLSFRFNYNNSSKNLMFINKKKVFNEEQQHFGAGNQGKMKLLFAIKRFSIAKQPS